MPSYSPLKVDLLSGLRALPIGSDATVVLVVGALSMNDGLGGFYRWDATSAAAEETKFWNVVKSDQTPTGRWTRVFQRVRIMPGGYMVINGGVKSYYATGVVNASGTITVYLTDTATATGNPLFTEVWTTAGDSSAVGSTTSDTVVGAKQSLSADLKTLVYRFVRGNSQTLGGSLLAIVGLAITPLQAAPAGTAVALRIDGI